MGNSQYWDAKYGLVLHVYLRAPYAFYEILLHLSKEKKMYGLALPISCFRMNEVST
jgi:hypothetical protein